MEGISGTYGFEDRPLVKRMLNELRHRGPDRSKTVASDRAVLGANALSVGAQAEAAPIAESDGVSVASDSCLYNRDWLVQELLEDDGEPMSDPELILRMYEQMGTQLFGYLDGAYAVSIVEDGKTILARDRYGLKPLYLSGGIRKGVYSSEMKSQLLADDEFIPFPPGKFLVRGKGFYPIRTRRSGAKIKNRASQAKTLRDLIVDGVAGCSEGTDRYNILLSGGIDSSVVASAASMVSDDMKTVCVGVDGGEDLEMASAVADRLGTDHTEYKYDVDQMLEMLDHVTYAAETFDFPLVRSCIPNYMATHIFDDKDRITLCGEGGDEIFAGYDYMRDIKGEDGLRRERMKLLRTGHTTGFQRVDRMNASASLDGRMPLMARPVIDYGLSVNRRALIGPRLEQSKLLLRKAFEDLLPAKVMKRKKQRFSDGAGSIHALVEISEETITDREFERERKKLPKNRIRTKEELLYYRSFKKHFGDSESVLNAVGFTPRP
jgi:asparagine synthase (glutamine-hydrolysing)